MEQFCLYFSIFLGTQSLFLSDKTEKMDFVFPHIKWQGYSVWKVTNLLLIKREGIGETCGEDLNGSILVSVSAFCSAKVGIVCAYLWVREKCFQKHTHFFSAGRITVFTPENTQVTDKVVLKETVS